jgi:hypothetical protein
MADPSGEGRWQILVYLWVRTNLQAHGYTVVALHLRSILKGIES